MNCGTKPDNTCGVCKFCNNDFSEITSEENKLDKCRNWLQSCSLDDGASTFSDTCECSSVFSDSTNNSAMDSGHVFTNDAVTLSNKVVCGNNGGVSLDLDLNKENSNYGDINIYKSKKVHIGNVTYINGPVILKNNTTDTDTYMRKIPAQIPDYGNSSIAISRTNWLAQPPLEREFLNGPAKFVIIGHTASEEGFTQAENTLLIRLTQTFHIESRKWNDIAFNYLIGSDGNAYEGRGWGVVGAHTRNYNYHSIGISFVGCFLNHLPPNTSLKKAKTLIEYGVKVKAISPDYILLAHCQCSAVESPGKRLFEEIKTWEHWDGSITVTNPSEYISKKITEVPSTTSLVPILQD